MAWLSIVSVSAYGSAVACGVGVGGNISATYHGQKDMSYCLHCACPLTLCMSYATPYALRARFVKGTHTCALYIMSIIDHSLFAFMQVRACVISLSISYLILHHTLSSHMPFSVFFMPFAANFLSFHRGTPLPSDGSRRGGPPSRKVAKGHFRNLQFYQLI